MLLKSTHSLDQEAQPPIPTNTETKTSAAETVDATVDIFLAALVESAATVDAKHQMKSS